MIYNNSNRCLHLSIDCGTITLIGRDLCQTSDCFLYSATVYARLRNITHDIHASPPSVLPQTQQAPVPITVGRAIPAPFTPLLLCRGDSQGLISLNGKLHSSGVVSIISLSDFSCHVYIAILCSSAYILCFVV